MRAIVPDSIAARTMIVLLVGLTLSHIASTWVLSNDRHDAVFEASERLCADRVAVMARLIDKTSSQDRGRLIDDSNSSLLAISLSDRPKVGDGHFDTDDLPRMQAALQPYFGAVEHKRLHVTHHRTSSSSEHSGIWHRLLNGFPEDRIMEVSFQLSDGGWANFELAMARTASLWSPHAILSTLVMMVAVLVFGAWATGWIARPLAAFAGAAGRLGRDVAAPPLPEDGPREVRHAVAAFNEMQGRIRRFVEDRTQMLAAISHDLRSPITRVRLRTEVLPPGEGRDKMLADLDEMAAMVASTLDFARQDATDEPTQAIDLAATLQAICDNAVDMGLAAEFDWSGRLVCTCRPLAIKRALANLVENGCRFGGQVAVHAGHHGSGIKVVIEDQGPGIPEGELERVFAPFFRIETSRNRKTGGIGLGLSVARTIIRAHGGDVSLENRKEGGLRVTVTLPQGTAS
ncbi:MAG: ATP-binding protein [Phaeospirillum sp.]|nr:ATP-binding protein [Phaeospirillum sp.]